MGAELTTKSSTRRELILIANPVVSIILSVLLTIGLRVFVIRYWPDLTSLWSVWWRRTISTFVIALIGWRLFLFRKHYQWLYGISEISFAVAVIWISLEKVQTKQDPASWIAIVAAAYLVVRGLINCEEGMKKGWF